MSVRDPIAPSLPGVDEVGRPQTDELAQPPTSARVRPWGRGAATAAGRADGTTGTRDGRRDWGGRAGGLCLRPRSEEHTSELQSRQYLVCRLLLEKKTTNTYREEVS